MRIERFLDPARRALRGSAAIQIRNDLYCYIGNRTGKGQQREYPYPDLVSPGLDAMDDEQDLDRDREYEEPGHASLTRRERPQAYWAALAISTETGSSRLHARQCKRDVIVPRLAYGDNDDPGPSDA